MPGPWADGGDPDRLAARLAMVARGMLNRRQAELTPDDCPIAIVLASDISTPVEDDYVPFDAEHYWGDHDSSVERWIDFHLPPAQALLAKHGVRFTWELAESIEDGPRLVVTIDNHPLVLATTGEDEQGWRAGVRLYRHLDRLLGDRRLYLTTVDDRLGWVFCWDDDQYALVCRADPEGPPEPVADIDA